MADTYPASVPEVEERIQRQWDRLFEFVDRLTAFERDELRDPAGWSTKDHIAHLAMWERSILYLLTGRSRHSGLGIDEAIYLSHDYDDTNNAIFVAHRERSWDSIFAEFHNIHDELLATLHHIGWDGLQLTYSHYAPYEPGSESGDPIIYFVAGNTFYHYDEHLQWIQELLARAST